MHYALVLMLLLGIAVKYKIVVCQQNVFACKKSIEGCKKKRKKKSTATLNSQTHKLQFCGEEMLLICN